MHVIDRSKKKLTITNKLKLYSIFWVFLIVIFSAIIYIQKNNCTKLAGEIAKLTQQLEEAEAIRQTLQKSIDFNKSDKFIEDYAHEESGLVHPNEVIIINDNYE